jgi:hypothetical protein
MAIALIKLAYRQVINIKDEGDFEKKVFNATYREFLLKSQAYNLEGKFKTFTRLKANDGRANSLHYKLSFTIGSFLKELGNKMPGLKDNNGDSLVFEGFGFELVESNIEDKATHEVAIKYNTGTFTVLNTIGEYLVLAKCDVKPEDAHETITVKMQPGLSIVSYKEIDAPTNIQEVIA